MASRLERMASRVNLVVDTVKNVWTGAVVTAGPLVWLGTAMASVAWLWAAAVLTLGAVLLGVRHGGRPALNADFTIQSLELTYVIDESDHRRHRVVRRYTLRAREHGATIFSFPHSWSGGGPAAPAVTTTSGHRVLGDVAGYANDRDMVVHLGRPHARRETVELEIHQDLHDEQGRFGHSVAETVRQRVDFVRLSVQLPSGLAFAPEVRASVDVRNRRSVWVRRGGNEVVHTGNVWSVTFTRPRPVGANVVLSWSWDDSY